MWREKGERVSLMVVSLCLALLLLLDTGVLSVKAQDVVIRDPQIIADTSMKAGIKSTWDCVWFGRYPQSEVTAADGAVYTKLQNAGGWDVNGDITIDGTKYRRMRKSDATKTGTAAMFYKWEDPYTYHFFRYEPIKWRVFETNGNYLLLADKIIDSRLADQGTDPSFGWDMCSLRSWLNGYDAGMNKYGKDYTKSNFIDCAFSEEEKAAIVTGSLDGFGYDYQNGNVTNVRYFITQDQIFLLSTTDVFKGERPVVYGFHAGEDNEPDEGRTCGFTTYSHAMGLRDASWYLRTALWYGPGYDKDGRRIWKVSEDGSGRYVKPAEGYVGVRPALYLDATALALYNYAGKVCSDGTVNEQNIPLVTGQPPADNSGNNNAGNGNNQGNNNANNGNGQSGNPSGDNAQKSNPSFAYTKKYHKSYGDKPFALQVRLKTGDGSLSYESSNGKVASVSSAGKVTVKGPGACTITIRTKETKAYKERSISATLLVDPKRPSIKTLKPGKGQMKAVWQKDAKADGYQIQYSTSKKFTKKTTNSVSVKNGKTASRTIKKLKKGKQYYVRMRSYKKTGLGGKDKTLYSAWSKVTRGKKIK